VQHKNYQGERVTNLKGLVVMSIKERDQIAVFENIKQKRITQKEAGSILSLSLRQVKRKHKKYLKSGVNSLIHGNRGRPGNKRITPEKINDILSLLVGRFKGFGPTFAAEKLLELYNIKISNESLRKLMIKHTLWIPKKSKAIKHVWRERKHCIGELIQLDGSKHIWFNGEYWTLLAFIDDATSKIMHAEFAKEETIESLAIATKKYVRQHGRPVKLYTDRGKVFKVNNGINRKETQYQRMLRELNVDIIHAYSPQAKGRIERLFKTLQDRLVKEFALQNIYDVENANKYLQEVYIPMHNEKYSVEPLSKADVHRSVDGYDLNTIFCIKEIRILKDDNTIVYKNRWFQIDKKQLIVLKKGEKITVLLHFDNTIQLMARNVKLACKAIAKQPSKKVEQRERVVVIKKPYKPPISHPWKVWQGPIEGDFSKLRKR
jgi:transposase InsO family protein